MIKYSSKDIIKRAEQLADLENSDFISDYEKEKLLNESWIQLYQKIVDTNDKTWIKKIYVSNGDKLPKDFFILAGLYTDKTKTQILKRNTVQASGYELENNKISLSNDFNNCTVVMEYYPVPQTLFYMSEKRYQKDFVYSPRVFIDENFYIDTQKRIVEAQSGEIIKTITTAGLIFKNGILTAEGTFYNWSEEEIETRLDKPFVIKGNEITYDDVGNTDLSTYLAYVTDESGDIAYFIDRDFKIYTKSKEFTNFALSDNSIIFCRQDGLYFTVSGSGKISRLLGKTIEYFNLNFSTFCAFTDDKKCIVLVNNKYFEMSYGFNSMLDYPNNIYFILLSYMLAIAFKLKQNGDVTALSSKCEEISAQFFESLSRDANSNYSIKNVYSTRGRLWL